MLWARQGGGVLLGFYNQLFRGVSGCLLREVSNQDEGGEVTRRRLTRIYSNDWVTCTRRTIYSFI